MFKKLVPMAFVAVSFGGSILSSTTLASEVYYSVDKADNPVFGSRNLSYADSAMPGGSHHVAGPKSIIVAEEQGWCYWHPYHCREDD